MDRARRRWVCQCVCVSVCAPGVLIPYFAFSIVSFLNMCVCVRLSMGLSMAWLMPPRSRNALGQSLLTHHDIRNLPKKVNLLVASKVACPACDLSRHMLHFKHLNLDPIADSIGMPSTTAHQPGWNPHTSFFIFLVLGKSEIQTCLNSARSGPRAVHTIPCQPQHETFERWPERPPKPPLNRWIMVRPASPAARWAQRVCEHRESPARPATATNSSNSADRRRHPPTPQQTHARTRVYAPLPAAFQQLEPRQSQRREMLVMGWSSIVTKPPLGRSPSRV